MKNKTNTGTFYILKIQDDKHIKYREGLKIFGVRFAKFLPEGWVHWTGCTPSPDLLAFCKELEKNHSYNPHKYPKVMITELSHHYLSNNPEWDDFTYKNVYLPNFVQSLNSRPALEEIQKIQGVLDSGQDVYYGCYCQDHLKCHRRILAAIIQKKGYPIDKVTN